MAKFVGSDLELFEKARELYESDDIAFDPDPHFSYADKGIWIQAWVWVPDPDDDQ